MPCSPGCRTIGAARSSPSPTGAGCVSTCGCRGRTRRSSCASRGTMTELFWPGDRRAGALFGDQAFVTAMIRVEVAWLQSLRAGGIAPDADASAVPALDASALVDGVEAGGNPV